MLISKNFLTREASYKPSLFEFVEPIPASGDAGGLGRKAEIKALKHAAEIGILGSFANRREACARRASPQTGRVGPDGAGENGPSINFGK